MIRLPLIEGKHAIYQPHDRAEMEAMLEKAARPRESWLAA